MPVPPQSVDSVGFEVSEGVRVGRSELVIRGEVELATVDELRQGLARALDAVSPTVVLDLRELEFIDATGLSAVRDAAHRLAVAGRRLLVVPARDAVHRTFVLGGLADTLTFLPSRLDGSPSRDHGSLPSQDHGG